MEKPGTIHSGIPEQILSHWQSNQSGVSQGRATDKLRTPQKSISQKPLTPRGYADAVFAHSKQGTEASLYPGQNFENLGLYLRRPFEQSGTYGAPPSTYQQVTDFAITLYDFFVSKPKSRRVITRLEDLGRSREDLSQDDERPSLSMLFLRGQPSPEWLSTIGARYHIDPEYFQRHLEFCFTVGRVNYFSALSLPSNPNYIIRLRYMTVGRRDEKGRPTCQSMVDSLRLEGIKHMDRYAHCVGRNIKSGTGVGDSIVRAYHVHDETHFSIEQDISIHMSRTAFGPICLVWLDTGKDLSHGPEGPWPKFGDRHAPWPSTTFYPTIQHQPRISLKSHRTSVALNERPSPELAQSSALLHIDYGKTYDPVLMACDPFYSLDEIFTFCANSESHVLNLMESKLSQETGWALLSKKNPQLSNLLYSQDILEAHKKRLRENIEIIKMRGGLNWPRATEPEMRQKAETAASTLLKHYEHLLLRVEELSERCQRGMSVIISNTNIAESKRAIAQASEVTKLTKLAFLYVPLNFMTSFFGMNLTPITADQPHSLWLWVVTSLPIIAFSILALVCDISTLIWISVASVSRLLGRLHKRIMAFVRRYRRT